MSADSRKSAREADKGVDFEGQEYTAEDLARLQQQDSWYTKAADYWQRIPATVDGVLGGFGHVAPVDEQGSCDYIDHLITKGLLQPTISRNGVALDVGAGVGRVSKNVLLKRFRLVDLLEPDQKFLEQARHELATESARCEFLLRGMQDFEERLGRYDVVWIQWVIGHLRDAQFKTFMERVSRSLAPGGIVVVKENISREGFVLDTEDSSVTRSEHQFLDLFHGCGLHLEDSHRQSGMPRELFPVVFYTLVFKSPATPSK